MTSMHTHIMKCVCTFSICPMRPFCLTGPHEPQRQATYLWTFALCRNSDNPTHSRSLTRSIILERQNTKFVHVDKDASDQHAVMHMLIWVFIRRIYMKVHFLTLPARIVVALLRFLTEDKIDHRVALTIAFRLQCLVDEYNKFELLSEEGLEIKVTEWNLHSLQPHKTFLKPLIQLPPTYIRPFLCLPIGDCCIRYFTEFCRVMTLRC